MPRFFFDIFDGNGCHHDEFGDDFDDIESARQQAQGLLPDIARTDLPNGDKYLIACEVWDETGRVVYRGELSFRGTAHHGKE